MHFPSCQRVIHRIQTQPGINKVTIFAERIFLTAVPDLITDLSILLTVPCFLQRRYFEIRKGSHLEIVTAADAHSSVRKYEHIRIGHQAGLFDDLDGVFSYSARCPPDW